MNLSLKQRERRRRGLEFQAEVIEALHGIHGTQVIRLRDGQNESPGDVVVITPWGVAVIEIKRVAGDRFKLSSLRPNQIHGLLDVDARFHEAQGEYVDAAPRYGCVLIGFDRGPRARIVYLVRLSMLIRFLAHHKTTSVTVEDLALRVPWAFFVPAYGEDLALGLGAALRGLF